MNFIELAVLAIIQGITEFLPISSSAHLILASRLMQLPHEDPYFDIAIHFGSLMAIIIYLREDIKSLITMWIKSFSGKKRIIQSLPWLLIIATLPTVIIGWLIADKINLIRNEAVIAYSSIVFGLLLYFADDTSKLNKTIKQLKWKEALVLGFWQAAALIPGASRSGTTMTAALLMGFDRKTTAKISFLMAAPIIFAASTYTGIKNFGIDKSVSNIKITLAALIAFISATIFIHLFMKVINKFGLKVFAVYRIVLGILILLII